MFVPCVAPVEPDQVQFCVFGGVDRISRDQAIEPGVSNLEVGDEPQSEGWLLH